MKTQLIIMWMLNDCADLECVESRDGFGCSGDDTRYGRQNEDEISLACVLVCPYRFLFTRKLLL